MSLPREIELKLEFQPGDAQKLEAALVGMGGEPAAGKLLSVYFDTPGQDLRRAGLSLRVRHDGDRRIQTIKSDALDSVGLFDRSEWEHEIEGDLPALDLSAPPLVDTFHGADALPVEPVFTSKVTRTSMIIATDTAEIEVAIDVGEVDRDPAIALVNEVEFELKRGDVAALFALARHCDDSAPLRLGVLSKSDRGYRLCAAAVDAPAKAAPVVLDPDMSVAEAFRAIAWSCLRQFRLNEAILLRAGDAGALHQARVALRRLRSSLSLFKPIVADARFAALRDGLRQLAATLGDARNLDVLIDRTTDPALCDCLQPERAKAYDRVQSALMSSQVRGLMLDIAEWLTVGDWLVNPIDAHASDQSVVPFAADRLKHLRKTLRRRGRNMVEANDEERHETRIAAKQLRYASEFFAMLYARGKPGRRHERFLDKLEDLQTGLGTLNDLATAPQVLEHLGIAAGDAPSPLDRATLIQESAIAYRKLVRTKPFW